uniref:Uncharacterized protein n=1 Tax=Phage sp. ctPtC7 TaxID=2825794 RepID=A0A8S5PBV6_9VIRU|nr:MAG TPA: hypothetical protein [Phage sp. ctPtC7]
MAFLLKKTHHHKKNGNRRKVTKLAILSPNLCNNAQSTLQFTHSFYVLCYIP